MELKMQGMTGVPGEHDVYFHLRYRCPAFSEIAGHRRGCVAGCAAMVRIEDGTLRVCPAARPAPLARLGLRNVHAFVRENVTRPPRCLDGVRSAGLDAARLEHVPQSQLP